MEPQVLKRAPLAAAVAALALTAWPAIRHLREAPPAAPAAIRLTFPAPPGAELGSADAPLDAAISPDETQLAFVAATDGVPRLWLRALDDERAAALAGTEGASLPAWKRGGGVIAFFAGGRLKQVTLADRRVHDLGPAPSPGGAAWLADGSLLFAPGPDGPLQRLRDGGRTEAAPLQPGDRAHVFPSSSDGGAFVYVAVRDDGRRVVRLVRDGDRGDLTATAGHAQLVGDRLLHVRDGVLVGQRIDFETAALTGRAVPLAAAAAVSASGQAAFAASPRLLIVAAAAPPVREMVWFDDTGAQLGPADEPGDIWQVRLSPDDQHAAVTLVDPLLKTLDVMTVPLGRPGDRQRLTLALAADTDPVWSPDGRRVMFRSMEDGRPKLFQRGAHDPAAAIEAGPPAGGDATPTDWRRESMLLTVAADRHDDIVAIDADGTRTPIADTGFNERDGRWSPDGRWIAFVSDESGQLDVYARPAPRGGAAAATPRTRVSFAGGTRPRWSADGRVLFFLRGAQLLRADLQDSRFTNPRPIAEIPGIRDFDTAHRSRRLLVLRSTSPALAAPATVVNWGSLEP